jgi:hypothetical protein
VVVAGGDEVSGAGVEVSGAGVEVSGAGVEVSGAGVEVSGAGDAELVAPLSVDVGVVVGEAVESMGAVVTTGVVSVVFVTVVVVSWTGSAISASSPQ